MPISLPRHSLLERKSLDSGDRVRKTWTTYLVSGRVTGMIAVRDMAIRFHTVVTPDLAHCLPSFGLHFKGSAVCNGSKLFLNIATKWAMFRIGSTGLVSNLFPSSGMLVRPPRGTFSGTSVCYCIEVIFFLLLRFFFKRVLE